MGKGVYPAETEVWLMFRGPHIFQGSQRPSLYPQTPATGVPSAPFHTLQTLRLRHLSSVGTLPGMGWARPPGAPPAQRVLRSTHAPSHTRPQLESSSSPWAQGPRTTPTHIHPLRTFVWLQREPYPPLPGLWEMRNILGALLPVKRVRGGRPRVSLPHQESPQEQATSL